MSLDETALPADLPVLAEDTRPPAVAAAAAWLLLGAGALFVAGSCLPWLSATTPFGTVQRGALDGPGVITLAAGVLLLACGAAGLARVGRQAVFVVGLLAALAGAAVAAYGGARVQQWLVSTNADQGMPIVAELGVGMVLVGLAVLPALAGLCAAGSRFVLPVREQGRVVRPPVNAALQALAVVLLAVAVGLGGWTGATEPLDVRAAAVEEDEAEQEDSPFTSSSRAQGFGNDSPTESEYGNDADLDLGEGDPALPADAFSGDGDAPVAEAPVAEQEVVLDEPVQQLPAEEPEPEPEPEPELEPEPAAMEPLALEAEPGSGPRGSVITVVGAGWVPGSHVTLVYTDPATGDAQEVGAVSADSRGRFSADLLPSDAGAPGGRVISALGEGQQRDARYEMTG